MMTIKLKRTTVAGRVPTTQNISVGELGLNVTDGILYSTNGSAIFAVGANNTNVVVSNTLTVNTINANGSAGTQGQFLSTNGTSTYWSSLDNYINTTNNYVISGTHTFTNDTRLNFRTTNGNNVSFVQQTDDNFVFYSTSNTGTPRPIWSVYANSNNSEILFSAPAKFADSIKMPVSTPASNSAGTTGQIIVDGNYIYVCVSTNTWKRASLSSY